MTRRLVMLHGFTGTTASWDEVIARLGAGVDAQAEAIFGHDASLTEVATPTFEGEVARLAARIRDRGPGPVEVVGYSMGARLGLGLMTWHPALVSRGWLIGGSAGLSTDAARAERRGADEVWAQELERYGIEPFASNWEKQELFASQASLPPAVRRREAVRRRCHDPAALARSLRALGLGAMPDLAPGLRTLRAPVWLVAGEADAKFRGIAEGMAEQISHATVRTVSGAGHNVGLERPEALASILMEVRR
jgi:2-succinyl-6-hydroxy-2,4-cyclohexadiene-1-carboxylate synthase